jgi:glycosyltransferase involved in cell wall biosynthesis
LGQAFEPNVPIDIIPNGVDVDRFQPVQRSWSPGRMLFVGRIVYQKGLDVLFRALGGLLDVDWNVTLVGDGTQRPFLESRASEYHILDRIHFTGWLTGDAVVEAYQHANLYVAPSRHEGMSNVVLEAMASGLPVVATQIAGNEELISPEENGFLVPPDESQSLESALRTILSNPDKLQKMGQASRERVVKTYTWSATAEAYLEILEEIVAGK